MDIGELRKRDLKSTKWVWEATVYFTPTCYDSILARLG